MTTTTTPVYVSLQVFKSAQFNGMAYGDMATASAFCSQYTSLLEDTIALLCPGFTMANKDTFAMDAGVRHTMNEMFKFLDMVLDSVDIADDVSRNISLCVAVAALGPFWNAMVKIHILNKLF